MIFNFNKTSVLPMLRFALDKKLPVTFVKDEGVYLLVKGWGPIYARNCDPHKNPGWFQEVGEKIGFEDLSAPIDDHEFFLWAWENSGQWKKFRFHLNQGSYKVSVR